MKLGLCMDLLTRILSPTPWMCDNDTTEVDPVRNASESVNHNLEYSKWLASNIWIRDVCCYPYVQDKCTIMNQRLVHDRALVVGVRSQKFW